MKRLTGMVALLLLLPAGTALADEAWTWGLRGGASLQHTRMQEFINGEVVVEESGVLPGGFGELFVQHGPLRLGGQLRGYDGDLDYDGQAQDNSTGVVTPFSTETGTTYSAFELSLAAVDQPLQTRALIGYERWQRSVKGHSGVGGANEDYRWWYAGAGLGYRFELGPQWALTPALDVWKNFDVKQKAQSGTFDARLEPEGKTGAKFGIALDWALDTQTRIGLKPYARIFKFGQSPVVQVGPNSFIYQPEIRYRQVGIDLDLERRF